MQQLERGSFGLTIVPSSTSVNERQILVLRLLGRLEFMLTSQLAHTVYRVGGVQMMYGDLRRLEAADLVWSMSAPFAAITVRKRQGRYAPPMRQPKVFGLTNTGHALLDALDVEPDTRTLESLKHRDPRGRPPNPLMMPHDLQASWYCTNVLESARRSRYVRSVYVQMEYVIHERQRIDALIMLRMSKTPIADRDLTTFPLFSGLPPGPDEYDVRLALEVDRDTEQLKTLVGKGETYRDLTKNNTYAKALGGLVMPVFLVPSSSRAARISRGWRTIWPDGWGIISSPIKADARQLGVLWGTYLTMHTSQPLSPLVEIVPQPQGVRFPLHMTREAWIDDQLASGILPPSEGALSQNEHETLQNA